MMALSRIFEMLGLGRKKKASNKTSDRIDPVAVDGESNHGEFLAHEESTGSDSNADDAAHAAEVPAAPKTHQFKAGGRNVIAGLEWSDFHSVAEARSVVGRTRAYVAGPRNASGTHAVGVAPRGVEKSGALSAALLIGHQYPDALIFQQLGDGPYWVCGIGGGSPLPGSDLICSDIQTARAQFTELSQQIGGTTVVKIGGQSGWAHTVEQALETSIEAIAQSGGKKATLFEPYRLVTDGFRWGRFLSIVAVLSAVAAAGVFGWRYWEQLSDQRKRDELVAAAVRTERERAAEAARKAAMIKSFHEQVEAARLNFGRMGVASSHWSACEGVRRSLPESMLGYQPSKLNCDIKKGVAVVEWMPYDNTVRLVDRKALPGVVDPYATNNPAISQFPIKPLDEGRPSVHLNPDAVRMAILDWGGVRLRGLTLAPSTPVDILPPPEIAAEPGVVKLSPGLKAALAIAASGPVDVQVVASAVAMLDSYAVAVETVTWSQPSAASRSVQLTGVLYLPKAND